MGKHRKPPSVADQSQQQEVAAAARPPARSASEDGGSAGAAAWDAAPSNTASHKCNTDYFQSLRWGIDSLYLLFPGAVLPNIDIRLKALKKIAQSPEPPATLPRESHSSFLPEQWPPRRYVAQSLRP